MKETNETTSANNLAIDLENYFANTIIPQLFIDADLILRIFTPPAMKQFTLTKDDINKPIKDVTDNIRYPTLIENINEVIATGVILEKEVQTTDKLWFQMNILPYVEKQTKKNNGVIVTFVDITKRITTLNELEKLNAENETLLYALTHDIKQPLSTIALLHEGLTDAYHNRDTGLFNKCVETLQGAAKSMKTLLNDFAQNIRPESELTRDDERLNIEDIFNDVSLALRNEIYNNNVNITTRFNTSEIIFSRKNLRSILYNLVSNAIKYRKPGVQPQVTVATTKQADYVLLTVTDNGVGIHEAHHQTIFNKFSRLNKQVEGTGIGLYIVKNMLNAKGGKIEVDSVLGEGTTFSVYFKSGY